VIANIVFQRSRLPVAIPVAQLIGNETQCGCPDLVAVSIWMKPCEYINDWNCRPASSNQTSPSTVWTVRRLSERK